MPQKPGQKWEPMIPLEVVDIHLRSVEQLLLCIIDCDRVPAREFMLAKSRTMFVRKLVDALKQEPKEET